MFSFAPTSGWTATPYQSFYFIHTYPESEKVLAPVSNTQTCREYYIRDWRSRINKRAADDKFVEKAYALITMGQPPTGMYQAWTETLNQIMTRSIYILNSFEKEYKWPLTKVYPVTLANGRKMPAVFVIGSRKWTMSPYLMSIWTMGIRMGRGDWLPQSLLKLKHEKMVGALHNAARKQGMGDGPQVTRTIKDWGPFMSLYHDLFGGHNRKYHWQNKHLHGYDGRPEGIYKLVTGTSHYKELYLKYKELKEAKKLT